MNILKLQGLDGRLFDLVAPLVMNPAVLRQNNNYPFKTTRNHVWYIAMDEQRVLGFMPVKMTLTNNCIDNYYISGDNSSVIEVLLDRIIHDFSSDGSLVAVVHERHVEDFSMKILSPVSSGRSMSRCVIMKEVGHDAPDGCPRGRQPEIEDHL